MALNTFKCNYLTPLLVKGLKVFSNITKPLEVWNAPTDSFKWLCGRFGGVYGGP